MYSTSIAPESTKPPASLICGSRRIIIAYRRQIWWNRSIVQENATRGDEHCNQGARSRDAVSARENSAPALCHVFDTPLKRGVCAHLAGTASLSLLYREERAFRAQRYRQIPSE